MSDFVSWWNLIVAWGIWLVGSYVLIMLAVCFFFVALAFLVFVFSGGLSE